MMNPEMRQFLIDNAGNMTLQQLSVEIGHCTETIRKYFTRKNISYLKGGSGGKKIQTTYKKFRPGVDLKKEVPGERVWTRPPAVYDNIQREFRIEALLKAAV